jgi:hypothetical protein
MQRASTFAKPKLLFKNIGRYAATSTVNFTQILDTKNTIEQHYALLLDKHEDPFKTISKTTTDVSLLTISACIEDFQDMIKVLPQMTKIPSPGRPKRFVAIGLTIAAMAMSSFYAYRITELNSEISALKSKMDLLVDVSHLHEAHLHHLEEKTDATNKPLADILEANIWFTAKLTDTIENKFQSVVHHHENVVNQLSTIDWLQLHSLTTFWMKFSTKQSPWQENETWSPLSTMSRNFFKWKFHNRTTPKCCNSH